MQQSIKILIFIRKVVNRDPDLKKFITAIQDPKTGIVTCSYSNIFELRKEVKSSLMKELSRTFKKYVSCVKATEKDSIKKIEGFTMVESFLESDIMDPILGDIKFNLSKDFTERVKIKEIKLKRIGQDSYEIAVHVDGYCEKGFVDLLIIDDKGKDLWFPDPNTGDSIQDMGKMRLNQSSQKTTWNFNHKNIENSKGLLVLVFEDVEGNKQDQRKFVSSRTVDLPIS